MITIPHTNLSLAEGFYPIPDVTYYEVCMASEEPLLGAHTAECADLREELEFFRKRPLSTHMLEQRRSRANCPGADYSHLDAASWLDIPGGLNPLN